MAPSRPKSTRISSYSANFLSELAKFGACGRPNAGTLAAQRRREERFQGRTRSRSVRLADPADAAQALDDWLAYHLDFLGFARGEVYDIDGSFEEVVARRRARGGDGALGYHERWPEALSQAEPARARTFGRPGSEINFGPRHAAPVFRCSTSGESHARYVRTGILEIAQFRGRGGPSGVAS